MFLTQDHPYLKKMKCLILKFEVLNTRHLLGGGAIDGQAMS